MPVLFIEAILAVLCTTSTPHGPHAPSEPDHAPKRERPADTSQPEPLRFGLRVAGLGSAGLVPGFGPGLATSAALLGRNWRVEAGWIHVFARGTQADGDPEVSGDVRLGVGKLRAGWVYRHRRLEVPLMAGIELGGLRARTELEGGRQRRLWAAFTAGPSLAWLPHRNVALWAGVDAVFPYLRPSFAVEGAGTLYSVPALGVRGLLGVELRLP